MAVVTHTIRHEYASTNVTTGAWVEIEDSMPKYARSMEIFDSSGRVLELGYGPSGSEQRLCFVMPGGNGKVDTKLDQGMRLAIKAVDATADAGELIINFLF